MRRNVSGYIRGGVVGGPGGSIPNYLDPPRPFPILESFITSASSTLAARLVTLEEDLKLQQYSFVVTVVSHLVIVFPVDLTSQGFRLSLDFS